MRVEGSHQFRVHQLEPVPRRCNRPAFSFRVSVLGYGSSNFSFRVSGFGVRVSGLGFRVSVLGFRVSGFRFRFSVFRFQASVFGFRVSDFGFRLSVFGFRTSAFGFRFSGFGFRVSGSEVRWGNWRDASSPPPPLGRGASRQGNTLNGCQGFSTENGSSRGQNLALIFGWLDSGGENPGEKPPHIRRATFRVGALSGRKTATQCLVLALSAFG